MGRVGLGWFTKLCVFGGSGWVGSGSMLKIFNKYAIYVPEIRRL